jgi:uncharacterized membrane protein YccC
LSRFQPYKQLNKLLENETFEATISWGIRMALAGTVPIVWGLATSQTEAASWIALTAECICWVELKGSFAQRMRVLTAGTVLALLFAILGSVTASNIWLSVGLMLIVGFISGLFKNLGDRGSGLAVSVFVLFIVANSYPIHDVQELKERVLLIAIGGGWNFIVGLAASLFIPAQEPYRRTIALIWKANASLLQEVSKGWDGTTVRSSIRNLYLKEKEIRKALDTSLHFYETMAHQVDKKDKEEYQLAQFRKATALISANILAISEELESVKIREVDAQLRLRIQAVLKALERTMGRAAMYVILLSAEEELLLASRIENLNKHILLLREYTLGEDYPSGRSFRRITQLCERTSRLVETSIARLKEMGADLPVFRSYSIIKTLYILHPKHWWLNTKLLFNLNTLTTRYALRSAVAATVAMFIYKWFEIEHGYWLPFTVIIVLQPYFGATIRKSIDRIIGTVAGGLVGGLLIRLPAGLYAKEIMLFMSFILMVYFIRKRYAVAAFFITISLVLLFDVEEDVNPMLIVFRALSTIAGAALAILAGFALLPNWDRKWLPIHLAAAINCNYHYFLVTFFSSKPINWTKHKRNAESNNSNAFDSFSRYMQEPTLKKKSYIPYYQLVAHNVRITRELNNIHLEQESRTGIQEDSPTTDQEDAVNECRTWFESSLAELKQLNPDLKTHLPKPTEANRLAFRLSHQQRLYLDKLRLELKALHKNLHDLNRDGSSRIP